MINTGFSPACLVMRYDLQAIFSVKWGFEFVISEVWGL